MDNTTIDLKNREYSLLYFRGVPFSIIYSTFTVQIYNLEYKPFLFLINILKLYNGIQINKKVTDYG
jgi:hypothetical protein